jgi:hypothetical protein
MNVSFLLTIAAHPPRERVASPFALPLRTALSPAKKLRVNSASRVRGLRVHHCAVIG